MASEFGQKQFGQKQFASKQFGGELEELPPGFAYGSSSISIGASGALSAVGHLAGSALISIFGTGTLTDGNEVEPPSEDRRGAMVIERIRRKSKRPIEEDETLLLFVL